MSETFEFSVDEQTSSNAVNGLVCAFALLIDTLESNGALRPRQFEGVLGSVLDHTGTSDGADVAILQQILTLLQAPERPPLTVIAGGKS